MKSYKTREIFSSDRPLALAETFVSISDDDKRQGGGCQFSSIGYTFRRQTKTPLQRWLVFTPLVLRPPVGEAARGAEVGFILSEAMGTA